MIKKIKRLIFGFSTQSRAPETVKLLGIRFQAARAELFRQPGLHDILILSVWDQPIPLCVILTDALRQDLRRFFEEARSTPEVRLTFPLHHQPGKMGFHVFNGGKTRRIILSQGFQKGYYTLTDSEIDRATAYFKKYVYLNP